MSRKMTVRLATERGGRPRGCAVGAPVPPGDPGASGSPPPERVPRVAHVLALAHHWRGLMRSGAVRDQAEVARLVGVSRARVTQVVRLLDLAPDIQEAVLDGVVDRPGVEKALRAIAEEPVWANQRRLWQVTRPEP